MKQLKLDVKTILNQVFEGLVSDISDEQYSELVEIYNRLNSQGKTFEEIKKSLRDYYEGET